MKILILPAWYPNPLHATTGDFVQYQARLLQRAGVEVSVLYNETNYRHFYQLVTTTNFNRENGIPTTRISGFGFPKVSKYFLEKWSADLVKALAMHSKQCGKPDLIHAHVWMGGFAARRIAQQLQIPYVVTEHSATVLLDELPNWKKQLARQIYQNAAACIAISPTMQQIFHQQYQVQTIPLIPNPIDERIFYYQKMPDSKLNSLLDVSGTSQVSDTWSHSPFVFLQIGDLILLKRPAVTLAAFTKLVKKYPHVRLQFIGTGQLQADLEQAVSRLKLTQYVQFCGQQPPTQVAKYLHQAHALVHTSEVETFGLVLAEAMCCGRPVVAVKSAGANFIVDTETGILTESGVGEVAAGMEQLLQNYAQYDSSAIAKKANDRFGSETVIRQLVALYERLC